MCQIFCQIDAPSTSAASYSAGATPEAAHVALDDFVSQ